MRNIVFALALPACSLPMLTRPIFAATYGEDVAFLKSHINLVELSDSNGQAKVAVAPGWQGRAMTSTADGDAGASYGWINRDLIASGQLQPHINAFGGEDRFWIGPEGGQFSLFFAKGVPFDLANWYTPKPIDTMPYPVVTKSAGSVSVAAQFSVTNYSGTKFEVKVERTVRLLDSASAWETLGWRSPFSKLPGDVKMVAYQSENKLTNVGQEAWRKETGLLSIWILGQFNPSPETTIVVPIRAGPDSALGVKVTSNYFGEIPPDRLKITDGVIYFSGDGLFRSKIGINPKRSKSRLGSYDAEHGVLSLISFNQPEQVTDYVNSEWKFQDHPFAGDSENSYNDGPPSPGAKPLGPFYEMESSSPAAELPPGGSISHIHSTMHLTGNKAALDKVARMILGVGLEDIQRRSPSSDEGISR